MEKSVLKTDRTISIARDFFPHPGGRYRESGRGSGEEFRDDYLAPALEAAIQEGSIVVVDMDGVLGYPSSFLEESFGGLIRERGFSLKQIKSHLKLRTSEPHITIYRDIAEDYLRDAARRPAGPLGLALTG